MIIRAFSPLACFALCVGTTLGAESVGQRPYEMVWANRTTDTRPALVDFENLDGWTVACVDAEASFQRSRQQQLWGQYVGALVYRGTGKRPTIAIKPPKPIPVSGPFNCVNLWVYGNNWFYGPDPKTPPVEIAVLLRGRNAALVRVVLGRVGWQEWWLMHRRLTDEQLALLKEGASLEAIEVSDGRNVEDRKLYFDNLAIYQEALPPLKFENRRARPFDPCPGRNTRRERRARAIALSHASANHPPRQSHGRVQDGVGAVGQPFRVPLSRAGRPFDLPLHAGDRHSRRSLGPVGARGRPVSAAGRRRHPILCGSGQAVASAGEDRAGPLPAGGQPGAGRMALHRRPADRGIAVYVRACAEVDADHRAVSRRRSGASFAWARPSV